MTFVYFSVMCRMGRLKTHHSLGGKKRIEKLPLGWAERMLSDNAAWTERFPLLSYTD